MRSGDIVPLEPQLLTSAFEGLLSRWATRGPDLSQAPDLHCVALLVCADNMFV